MLLTGKLVFSSTSLSIENYLLVNRRCLSVNLWHNHWNKSQYKQNEVIVSAKHLICLRNNLCIPHLEWSVWHISFFSFHNNKWNAFSKMVDLAEQITNNNDDACRKSIKPNYSGFYPAYIKSWKHISLLKQDVSDKKYQ